jgi:hypothetical protein
MNQFDENDSIGHWPRWRIALYLLKINAAYFWRKLRGRCS